MPKTKDVEVTREETTKPQETAMVEQETILEKRFAILEACYKALELRVAELEKHSHSDHTIGTEVLDQIATHAVHRVNEHLRKSLGFSGTPSA